VEKLASLGNLVAELELEHKYWGTGLGSFILNSRFIGGVQYGDE
jgi:hypothetical protein